MYACVGVCAHMRSGARAQVLHGVSAWWSDSQSPGSARWPGLSQSACVCVCMYACSLVCIVCVCVCLACSSLPQDLRLASAVLEAVPELPLHEAVPD